MAFGFCRRQRLVLRRAEIGLRPAVVVLRGGVEVTVMVVVVVLRGGVVVVMVVVVIVDVGVREEEGGRGGRRVLGGGGGVGRARRQGSVALDGSVPAGRAHLRGAEGRNHRADTAASHRP